MTLFDVWGQVVRGRHVFVTQVNRNVRTHIHRRHTHDVLVPIPRKPPSRGTCHGPQIWELEAHCPVFAPLFPLPHT